MTGSGQQHAAQRGLPSIAPMVQHSIAYLLEQVGLLTGGEPAHVREHEAEVATASQHAPAPTASRAAAGP